METYTVTRKRTITAEQQHICDVCQEPATSGCTDATEIPCDHPEPCGYRHWKSDAPRYGCDTHPVKPVEHFLNANA